MDLARMVDHDPSLASFSQTSFHLFKVSASFALLSER